MSCRLHLQVCHKRTKVCHGRIRDSAHGRKSDYSKLMSLAMKMLQSREMGAIEARNFVLAENPIKMDARFQFLNAVFPYKRKRMLKNRLS